MKEYWINSWEEIHNILINNSWNEDTERYRSPYAFSGLSNKDYKLKTSLIRLGGNFEKIEQHLLRNFRKYASRNLVEYSRICECTYQFIFTFRFYVNVLINKSWFPLKFKNTWNEFINDFINMYNMIN